MMRMRCAISRAYARRWPEAMSVCHSVSSHALRVMACGASAICGEDKEHVWRRGDAILPPVRQADFRTILSVYERTHCLRVVRANGASLRPLPCADLGYRR